MASPRLPFLYPNLMRAVKSCEPSTYRSIRIPTRSNARRAPFHTTRRYAQGSIQRRYGPAVEPNIPPPGRPMDEAAPGQGDNYSQEAKSGDDGNTPLEESQQSQSGEVEDTSPHSSQFQADIEIIGQPNGQNNNDPNLNEEQEQESEDDLSTPEPLEAKQPPPAEANSTKEQPQTNAPILDGNPLESVLHMPAPSSYLEPLTKPHSQHPNMAPPPYIHHFDTYSLVRDLANSSFSDEQSITIMKAVRKILQNNLDFAKQNLTSKSDVENETYLFQAACSELQSSLQTARNSEIQRQRASRTSLQHESDILSQRTNQELSGLKDDIKGMFNDHKMATRELQRSIDTSVQELNYKITVSLNSDSKSEIEGLRWILTRRAALAIAISAFMILLFLRYSSGQRTQNGVEKKKEPQSKESTEKRTPSEFANLPQDQVAVAHLSESLG
ncbi:hypothetical protein BJX99DRAFT_235706 [Aspergillus californicus]